MPESPYSKQSASPAGGRSTATHQVVAVIPARMASTRFPGKPLIDILGLPMIEHVRRRALLSPHISKVVVATCDREILDVVTNYGGLAVMTANSHERCTDRVAEAALPLEADIIVNIQGDEPLLQPSMLELLTTPLICEPDLLCTNLMNRIDNEQEFNSPDVVKTVCDHYGNALYFSREPIPSGRKAGNNIMQRFKQLGVIAFRKMFLHQFTSLPQTPAERIESVDMLRAVEHGYKVRMVLSTDKTIGVDTPADLERVIALMAKDPLCSRYR